MPTAYIALGSNIASTAGSPRQTLEAALLRLRDLGVVTARSALYETAPIGYVDQPSFINAAAALVTEIVPEALLKRLLALELEFGRDRSHGIANGPRTLDLDLLLYDDLILNTPALQLPHPRMVERAFVLIPLTEIAPDLWHPVLGKSMKELQGELQPSA